MKVFSLVLLATAYIALAVPVQEQKKLRLYPRFIEMPDGEGNLHQVDLEEEPDMAAIAEYTRNPNNNAYLLYTRDNHMTPQMLEMNNADSIINSNFNPNVPTVVISHGWLSSRYTEPNPSLRRVFLAVSDVNVITVCWRALARRNYATAVSGVPAVGRGVGQFLNFLHSVTGARFDQMHLTGLSLGAHVVGNAGRELGGKVARVTGLDPAGPLWSDNENRLSPIDGVYVEAIHTDGGLTGLGIGEAIAQVDFFPNGGISQPGCSTSVCDHIRAFELFYSSINHNHLIGRRCANMLEISTNTCTGDELPLGNSILSKTGSGMYRLDTGSTHPF